MTDPHAPDTQDIVCVDPDLFRADPHAGFAAVRAPHRLINLSGLVFTTRYADAEALLTHPDTRQIETDSLTLRGITEGPFYDFLDNVMLTSNAPAHPRRRAPVARTFAFKLMEAMRPRVRAVAEALLDETEAAGAMGLRDDFARWLPARIIAEILGVPDDQMPDFTERVYTMSRGLGAFRDDMLGDINAAAAALEADVAALLNARRHQPQDDFLTAYMATISALEGEAALSVKETTMQIVGLILAGSDTTRSGITAMIGLLMRDRALWEAVCAEPERLAAGCVSEALRLEPPVGAIPRIAMQKLDFAGMTFLPGALIVASVLSANRDAERFAEPDRFNPERSDHPRWHMAFGAGVHRCLGERLARVEMEEALIALATRHPTLRPASDAQLTVKGHAGLRTADRYPVVWDESRGR